MKIICCLLLILASFTAVCQEKAYLIKQSGDTLYGDIQLKNKQFIVSGANLSSVTLPATDVKKIHSSNFKGEYVLPCQLHIYADDLEILLKYEYISGDRDTVLVLDEVYSTPKMNLYWCKDVSKMQYYFYKTPTDPLPIQLYINYALGGGAQANFDKAYVKGQESIVHLEVQKGFVNQLRLVMGDCKKISNTNWEQLDYRIYSLKALINKYNKCN